MINKLNSSNLKKVMDKVLLIFVFYIVAAASFNGFFVKWAFLDNFDTFRMMYEETEFRPFVHRQLMISTVKVLPHILTDDQQKRLKEHFTKKDYITEYYSKANIPREYIVEYNLLYLLCVIFLFISMFILREISIEVTGNKIVGTLTACCFSVLFILIDPFFFYDFGELLFFSLATLFAYRGNWIALFIITPFAECNKESFLFFLITLFPLLMIRLGKKKAAFVTVFTIILSGITYLKILSIYADNPGLMLEWHWDLHLQQIFQHWLDMEFHYGVQMGSGMFLPHLILLAWIVKCTWSKLLLPWKQHIGLALIINTPLYILNCAPGELRNLSMLYMGFVVILSIFIKDSITEIRQ